MYKGLLIESMDNEIYGDLSEGGEIYIGLNKRFYQLINNKLEKIYGFKSTPYFSLLNNGVWINNDNNNIEFYDIFKRNISHKSIDQKLNGNLAVINEKIVGLNFDWGKRYIYLYSLAENIILNKVDGSFSYVNIDNSNIVARERTKGLYCFDDNLLESWCVDLGGQSYSKANQTPMFDNELVIINHSKSILAFNKNSGELVWQYDLETSPGSFFVGNGKVYLTEGLDIKVFDAQSGKLEIHEPSGYQEIDSLDNEAEVGVFPVNDYLYVFARYHSNLKFLSSDAKTCMQELELFPHGYGTGEVQTPILKGDSIIQGVSSGRAYAGNGLLILQSAEDNEELVIKKQERLPALIYAVPSLNEEHVQRVLIKGNSVDDICRFAGITIKELNFETGIIPHYSEKKWSLDRKHNGVIELVVDVDSLDTNAESELTELVKTLNKEFSETPALSGNGKNSVNVKLVIQKQEDWDKTGDVVDLDEIRKIQKPIS